MTLIELREKANKLPLKPGVYIMLDKSGEVIYVGKAKALKNRVSSYFRGEHEGKTHALVSKIDDFNVIVAASEFEALVLENSLIKRHKPHYNILLKDDKSYPFLRLDVKSDYPRFSLANRTAKDEARYFGPYGGRVATKDIIETLVKALKLPGCSRRFPRDIGKERPCLNYHLGACRAYCQADVPRSEYLEAIGAAVQIFEGKTSELIKKLTAEMDEAAGKLQFEVAAEKRDRLRAVHALESKQLAVSGAMADTDVFGFFRGQAKSCYAVLHYIDGKLLNKDFEIIDDPLEDDAEALSGIILQYYELRGVFPKNVILPFEISDRQPLEEMFSKSAGRRVYLTAPQRGDKRQLAETACVNAREETERATTREEKVTRTMELLQKMLNLDSPPERIEAFDISNTGSSEIVASMTVFVRNRPLKRDYRRFKIKTLENQDDYHSMAEVISRRAARFTGGDEKFSTLPDIMLIDGGTLHAGIAKKTLNDAGIDLPVFGMVKDDRHRTRALVTPDGDEIGISAQPAVFALVGTIQEETHRFAVEYHRELRSKNSYTSALDRVEGVGEVRRKALLKAFGSLKAVKAASIEELAAVTPKNVAESVYNYFHTENGEAT